MTGFDNNVKACKRYFWEYQNIKLIQFLTIKLFIMKKQLLFEFTRFLFREKHLRNAVYAVLFLLTAQSSFAQSPFTWTGTTSTDFLTNTNWTSTNLSQPTFIAADGYVIGASSNNPILNTNGAITTLSCSTLTLNNAASVLTTNIPVTTSGTISLSASGALLTTNNTVSTTGVLSTVSGSTVTTNANFTSTSASNSVINGTLNINSGTFTARHYLGTAGSGAAKIYIATGATLIGSGVSHIGQNLSANHEVNVNGGTYSIPSGATLNIGSSSNRRGFINLNSGLVQISGTMTLSASVATTVSQSNGNIVVAGGSFEYNPVNLNVNFGTISINGGTFKLLNTAPTINATSTTVGTATTGVINIGGGTLDASGPLTIGSTVSGVVTVNINSGTMNVAGALSVLSTATVNIDAGSIVLTGDQTTAINTLVSAGRIAAPGKQIVVNYNGTNTIVTAVGSTWNGSGWSNGTPSSTLEAIIDGAYSTTTNGAFTAYKLTVNAGKSLTINTGTNVTVQNQVINNGSLVVENNANLIQVNNTFNTGNIVVNRNSNALYRLDYTLWSSPVASQNLAAFSPLTSQSPSRFYTYTPGTPDVYTVVASPTTTTFAAGTGYLIRMPNTTSAVTPETFAGVFTGVPNNGTVSLTSLSSDKFYAVGNPYPSTVSAASFLSGNSTGGTLYFWRKTNGVANSGSSYATYTGVGGTAAGNVAPNDIVPNGTIQVGQGFIVKTGAAATSLQFTNAMREAAPTSTQFLKVTKSDEKSRIWLNLTAPGLFSQTLIGYVDGATEGVDNGFDGEYINDSKVALTSNIDGGEYVIQGRPAFDASDVVALNFKTDKAGEYKIAIDHTDGVFAKGQAVYLADSVTGKETDLTKESYTFTAESGTANNRFTLKYQSSSKTAGSPVFNENTVTVYKNNGTLYVNSAVSTIVTIKVFNLQGRLIGEQKDVNATIAAIKNLRATQQVLFVQVTSEDGKVVTKKVVN